MEAVVSFDGFLLLITEASSCQHEETVCGASRMASTLKNLLPWRLTPAFNRCQTRADTGLPQVTRWSIDGTCLSSFGNRWAKEIVVPQCLDRARLCAAIVYHTLGIPRYAIPVPDQVMASKYAVLAGDAGRMSAVLLFVMFRIENGWFRN